MGIQAVQGGKQKATAVCRAELSLGCPGRRRWGRESRQIGSRNTVWKKHYCYKLDSGSQHNASAETTGQDKTLQSCHNQQIITECRKAQGWESTILLIPLEKIIGWETSLQKPERQAGMWLLTPSRAHESTAVCQMQGHLTYIHCSRGVPLAGQPTLDTPFSLSTYPRKSRLPPNSDFSSIQPRFSIRELTWKFSPALRSSSEHRLLQLSCDLSHVWYSQASLKGGTEPQVWPTAPKSEFHRKDLWKTSKASTTPHRNGHILPLGTFLFWYTVIHHSATCP